MARILDLYSGLEGWGKKFRENGHEVVSVDMEAKFNPTIVADMLDVTADMLALYGPFDLIVASPPCEAFSVAALGRNWWMLSVCHNCLREVRLIKRDHTRGGDHVWEHTLDEGCSNLVTVIPGEPLIEPKSDKARLGMALFEQTLKLIRDLEPTYGAVIENPTAMARRLPIMRDLKMQPTSYCKLGEDRRKPTDIWTIGPIGDALKLPEPCKTTKNKNHPLSGQLVEMPDGRTFVTDRQGNPCHEAAPRGAKTGTQGLPNSAERAVIPERLSELTCEALERLLP